MFPKNEKREQKPKFSTSGSRFHPKVVAPYRCGKVRPAQHRRDKDEKVEQLLRREPASPQKAGLLEPLVLGDDADHQLDQRDERDKVKHGRNACELEIRLERVDLRS